MGAGWLHVHAWILGLRGRHKVLFERLVMKREIKAVTAVISGWYYVASGKVARGQQRVFFFRVVS